MDIDWSEPLADILGDELAYQLQISGNSFIKWGRESIKSFSMNVSEYLQEESRDVLTDTELEIFNTNVDQLREDVDRLQARLNSLLK
jgi:ubiquinone biosynthesis protein UbiJ